MSVDFSATGGADWDRMVIVCIGATSEQLGEVLGFDWDDAPDVSNGAFLASLVFVRGEQVESSWTAGADADWEFIPCPVGRSESLPAILSVERDRSVVRFDYDSSNSDHEFWYVSPKEFSRLDLV